MSVCKNGPCTHRLPYKFQAGDKAYVTKDTKSDKSFEAIQEFFIKESKLIIGPDLKTINSTMVILNLNL